MIKNMNLKEKYHPRTFTSDTNILKIWELSEEGCLFNYQDEVCRIEQHRFPPTLHTLRLISLETSGEYIGNSEPMLDIAVSEIDFTKLKIWRSEPFELEHK